MATRFVIGCMTGTSIDALDASLVEISGTALAMTARHVRSVSVPLGSLQGLLRSMADQHPLTAGDVAAIARDFALLHVDAIRQLLGPDRADLICVHGQTVFHDPPSSWQMFNPAPVAREFRAPVVSDLRAADLAAGGQGAPITPIADWVLLRERAPGAAVVNLGGFSNATVLPANAEALGPGEQLARIRAMDICACNQLLDRIARDLLGQPFDKDGQAAAAGTVHEAAAAELAASAEAPAVRSLGTGDETWSWVARHQGKLSPSDMAATACAGIGGAIARAVRGAGSILLAGGGAKNRTLVRAIRGAATCPVGLTDDAGVPGDFRESICFAILGALCQDRVPITLPQVTGCPSPAPVAGLWAFPTA